jgi:hypothetical protein
VTLAALVRAHPGTHGGHARTPWYCFVWEGLGLEERFAC